MRILRQEETIQIAQHNLLRKWNSGEGGLAHASPSQLTLPRSLRFLTGGYKAQTVQISCQCPFLVQFPKPAECAGDINFQTMSQFPVPDDVWYVLPIALFTERTAVKVFPSSRRRMSRFEKYREAWDYIRNPAAAELPLGGAAL